MAVPSNEIEVLDTGIVARGPSKGAFALNMIWRRDSWEVRKGLGTVAEFDSTLSKNILGETEEWGFIEQLGSYPMRTSFGHDQIVTVVRQRVHTGGWDYQTMVLPTYGVVIYDLTTRERWQEELYRRTSENTSEVLPLDRWNGHYETALDVDRQAWIRAKEGDYFWFQEFDDVLFFGSARTGVWAYMPSTFNRTRRSMVDSVDDHEWAERYSESAVVVRVALADGISQKAYSYLKNADLSGVRDCAVLDGHMVYATERRLWFSDKGFPANVIEANGYNINSEYPITAVAEQYGSLLIWTDRETWHFQPGQGVLFDTGRLTKLSDNVGCIGPNAVVRLDAGIAWADTNGVYVSSGSGGIKRLSEDIRAFFDDYVTNPLTSFYQQEGFITFDADGPRTRVRFDPRGAHLTYAPDLDALILGVPSQAVAMVLAGGKWSMWSTESMVYTSGSPTDARGGSTSNLPTPWFMALRDKLYCMAGPDTTDGALTDEAQRGGADINDDTTPRSLILCEYGRGGALDRSIGSTPYQGSSNEDRRWVIRKWYQDEQVSNNYNCRVYIDEPIPVEPGYALPGETTTSGKTVLLPISICPPDDVNVNPAIDAGSGVPSGHGLDDIHLFIAYDETHWTPVKIGATTNIDYVLPPERIASDSQWNTVAVNTNEIELDWQVGAGTPMNCVYQRKNPLIYIPMAPTGASEDLSAMGLEWGSVATSRVSGQNGACGPVLFVYEVADPRASVHADDDVAQAVDYAYKTDQVGLGEGQQLKARGLWARIMSHGNATTKILSDWTWGVYNVLVGSDQKGWQAQVLDHSGSTEAINELQDKATVRTRLKDSGDSLRNVTFGTTNVTWGDPDPNNSADGTYIIGDEQVSEIAVSSSTKGSRFSWMVFGFMRNRAERMIVEGLTAAFRVVSKGRRRRGH